MKNQHEHRILLRRWAAAAACCALSGLAAAQPVTPGGFTRNTAGFGAWYFAGGAKIGTEGLSLAPMANTASNFDNLSGWTKAGNFGVAPGATGVTVGNMADFSVPGTGKTVPIKVVSKITPASLGGALGRFAMKSLPVISTLAALPALFQELGLTVQDGQVGTQTTGTQYRVWSSQVWANTKSEAYTVALEMDAAYWAGPGNTCPAGTGPRVPRYRTGFNPEAMSNAVEVVGCDGVSIGNFSTYYLASQGSGVAGFSPMTQQQLADEIASKSGWPTSSNVAGAVREAVQGGERFELESPTVTGPGSVTGPKQTTNHPDGSRTEKQTVYNITYQGNTINNTTTTTTNTFNSSNVQTGSETTTDEESPPPEDACKTNPDSLGCQTLDEPANEELPKATRTLTYVAENLGLSGGSCPAPIVKTLGGQSVTVFDYSFGCDILSTYVKPLFLLLAAWIAFFILLPGKHE